jgi:phage gp29-like protein
VSIADRLRALFGRPTAGGFVLSEARPDTKEIGDTGHTYQAYLASTASSRALAKRLRTLETNYQLYESKGYEIYDRMRRSDPKVAGLLRAIRLPLLGAQVRIEPSNPEDERAVEVADFVSDNLFHGLVDPWRDTLSQFLLYLAHGHAPFEVIWGIKDGSVLIDRFAYRPPSTISDIYVSGGRIVGVHQRTTTGTDTDIPGEKLLWFVHDREGDDWRGTSLLRPMFKPWFAKEKLEILLLIAADRGNGTPVVIQPEGGWRTDETGASIKDAVDAALAAFCTAESGYFDLPYGATFQLVTSNASISELQALKESFDRDMSNVAIAQVLDLGKTETGSRALGRTMADMFVDSLQAIATDIEDTVNRREGVIEQLVAYNFPGAEGLIPKLRFGSLTKLDLRAFAQGLYQCWQMGMPLGEEVWEFLRSELDLPARKEDTPSQQSAPDTSPQDAPPAPAEAAPPKTEGESAAGGAQLSEGGYWRPITRLESFVALDEIAAMLDNAKTVIRERTQGIRNKLVAELTKRAMTAIASGDAAKVAALAAAKSPMVDVLASELRAIFGDYFNVGREQVADELARQKAGEPVVDEATGERRGETVGLAPRRKPTQAEITAWQEWVTQLADVKARGIAAATQSAVAGEAMRAFVTQATAEAIAEMALRASDEAALKAGLTVSQVMIAGRSAEAQAEREQIATCVYSAILDGATCTECERRDGDSTNDVNESLTWTPNSNCEGGERCRCLVIYEYKEGA